MNRLSHNLRTILLWAPVLLMAGGCGAVKEKRILTIPVAYQQAKDATLEELVDIVSSHYAGIATLTVARFEVEFTGGSIEDGYFEKYRTAKGYLVARNPDSVFVNILNPLTNSSVLVLASSENQFQVWIPSRNQFVTGRTDTPPDEDNPIYNVRPTHILDGILFEPVPQDGDAYRYYVEEEEDGSYKYYVLGIFKTRLDSPVIDIVRKIWIERSTLHVVRQHTYENGRLTSVVDYGDAVELEDKLVSTRVAISRPQERYSISFKFDPESVRLNRELKPDAFMVEAPPGAERLVVGEEKPVN